MMRTSEFFIDGQWVSPLSQNTIPVLNPSTEEPVAKLAVGNAQDVDRAVEAARNAFPFWSSQPQSVRTEHVRKLLGIYRRRAPEMANAMSVEMGAPIDFSLSDQVGAGIWHIEGFLKAIDDFAFEHPLSEEAQNETIVREPIGVCGLITPWNWPMNQVTLKVIPALLTGCTVVLKPSEIAPLSSLLFAELIEETGFPAGVFNLVNGDGPDVGAALSAHPDVDMMSFTGSTRAGITVGKSAIDSMKRTTLELGGKSPNLIFADADVEQAVRDGVLHCMSNTGQSCNAPTRMLVERTVYKRAVEIAAKTANSVAVGPAGQSGGHIGPLVSQAQFETVQRYIQIGIDEGARLMAGGPGKPEGFETGYFARPTVFADATNGMRIAQEEIFGPVLVILPFDTEEEAVAIANDSPYGLAGYLSTGDSARAHRVSRCLRAGMISINGAGFAPGSPFGGYKLSGIGREGGVWGLEDYVETKTIAL